MAKNFTLDACADNVIPALNFPQANVIMKLAMDAPAASIDRLIELSPFPGPDTVKAIDVIRTHGMLLTRDRIKFGGGVRVTDVPRHLGDGQKPGPRRTIIPVLPWLGVQSDTSGIVAQVTPMMRPTDAPRVLGFRVAMDLTTRAVHAEMVDNGTADTSFPLLVQGAKMVVCDRRDGASEMARAIFPSARIFFAGHQGFMTYAAIESACGFLKRWVQRSRLSLMNLDGVVHELDQAVLAWNNRDVVAKSQGIAQYASRHGIDRREMVLQICKVREYVQPELTPVDVNDQEVAEEYAAAFRVEEVSEEKKVTAFSITRVGAREPGLYWCYNV